MDKKTKTFFWVVCVIAVIGACLWSVSAYISRPVPLYLAFTVINAVSLVTVGTCLIIDLIKDKGNKD